MNKPVEIGTFATFAEASSEAKSLAKAYKETVELRHSGSGWSVMAYSAVANSRIRSWDLDYDSLEENFNFEESMQKEVSLQKDELRHELLGGQDDYAASEEDGWYYHDGSS